MAVTVVAPRAYTPRVDEICCCVGGYDGDRRARTPFAQPRADRPQITHGVQSGDVSADSGVVWARADRPSRMLVEVATTDSFSDIATAVFVDALPETDFTAKALIEDLPAGQDIFYRIRFQDLSSADDSASRRSAASAPRRPTAARSRSCGPATPLGRAGASTWRAAACAPTPPCWRTARLLHPLRRQHLCRLPDRGGDEAAERRGLAQHRHRGEIEDRPKRSTSFAATTNTICSTRTCARSTPRSRCSRNGTITR